MVWDHRVGLLGIVFPSRKCHCELCPQHIRICYVRQGGGFWQVHHLPNIRRAVGVPLCQFHQGISCKTKKKY
eukprot:CCRYP_004041-RA/>CCRYP_004041-RA protein AED:0.00 eAED:0.00 QI:39/1/1/1/0/0/2/0/71